MGYKCVCMKWPMSATLCNRRCFSEKTMLHTSIWFFVFFFFSVNSKYKLPLLEIFLGKHKYILINYYNILVLDLEWRQPLVKMHDILMGLFSSFVFFFFVDCKYPLINFLKFHNDSHCFFYGQWFPWLEKKFKKYLQSINLHLSFVFQFFFNEFNLRLQFLYVA